MILVLDACAFLNLLKSLRDEKYFDVIESEVEEVYIASDKIQKEIHSKRYENLLPNDDDMREYIDRVIIPRLARYTCSEDTRDCQAFLKGATGYAKENGEFYSAALSLYLSRMSGNKLYEQLLAVHLVSDDLDALEDFEQFFRTNQIGQIISSTDLMMVLYIRERITRKELDNFFFSLKSLYSRAHAEVKDEIKRLAQRENDVKIQSCLSMIMNLLESSDTRQWNEIKRISLSKSQKAKLRMVFELVDKFFTESSFQQIARIDNQRKQIEKVWTL